MNQFRVHSAAEQVSAHLREGIATGVWRGEMPGVLALADELRVNHKTVEAALSLLEREGMLRSQGARRPRRIAEESSRGSTRSLRIGIVMYDESDLRSDLFLDIRHLLQEAGHVPFVAKRRFLDIGMNSRKLAAMVERQPADAWLAFAPSRDALEWFSAAGLPVFAMFGRFRRLEVAGGAPDKTRAYEAAVRALVQHGHRKIVLLARTEHRQPVPSLSVKAFLDAMAAAGIETGEHQYHCPPWENSREGFHRCLQSMFQRTAPTALIVQEGILFGAVQQFLSARGILVPGDVSLVCTDPDPTFVWRIPTVAHIRWNRMPLVRRVAQWADQIALGKDDRRQLLTRAEYVPGGTVGPVRTRHLGSAGIRA